MSTTSLKETIYKQATLHFKNEEYSQASEKYRSLLPYLDEKNMWHAEVLGNFTISLKALGNFSEAEATALKRISWYEIQGENESNNSIIIARISLCEIYWAQEMYQQALDVMLPSNIKNSEAPCLVYNFIAQCYVKLSEPLLAKSYAHKALDAANNERQKENIRNVFKNLL